ncbi:MAG: hypothetical protein RL095_450 [Verrucomicrobiota bacterium]|jgi:transposase
MKSKTPELALGIDWAKNKHDWNLRASDGQVLEKGSLTNSPSAIEELIHGLLERHGGSQKRLHVGMESKDIPLARLLQAHDQVDFVHIAPGPFAHYRSSRRASKAKDDSSDAALLSDWMIRHHDEIRIETKLATPEILLLCRQRRDMVDDRVRLANRLRAALGEGFPGLEELFDKAYSLYLLKLIELAPVLQDFQKRRFRPLIDKLGRIGAATLDKLELLHKTGKPFIGDAGILSSLRMKITALRLQIDLQNELIEKVESRIAALEAESPLTPLIDSLPGAGDALRPRLTAALQTLTPDMSAEDFAVAQGIAPVTISSGKSHVVKHRVSGIGFDSQTFFDFSLHSMKKSIWAVDFYTAARLRGKTHGGAVRALAMKWIRIIVALCRSGEVYCEQRYLAAKAKRVKHPKAVDNAAKIPV